jgi:co-chaperonin GroES (HSP10)
MSDDKTKRKDGSFLETLPALKESNRRHIRKIYPLGFRVLVRIEAQTDRTDSGLYLPEGAKEDMLESVLAEVIEVASATDTHTEEETNVSGIPLGAKVLIPKTVGVRIPWDEKIRLVETQEILAIVEEVNLI